jgi:uncharacterized membrane protein
MISGAQTGEIRIPAKALLRSTLMGLCFLVVAGCLRAQEPAKVRLLYVGDASITAGAVSADSNFSYDRRGVGVEIAAQKILDAWRRNPRYEVSYLTGWEALAQFPETPEALKKYDVVILSDVDSDSLVLYPPERLRRAPMGPNRLKSIRDYVWFGGSLVMIGGYASFTGRHNAGNYHNSPVEEALPVDCLAADDDRMETPQGVTVEVKQAQHPIMRGIEWSPSPIFNGYNRLLPKRSAIVLATVKETRDPLIVVWSFGKGRAMAFASDIAPHWGAGFEQWRFYQQFWDQALDWLAAR